MDTKEQTLYPKIGKICKELERESDLIPTERAEKLLLLSEYISGKITKNETPKLIVICTHNSRRSHIGQIWSAVAADYFQLPEILTFSGGTEATAFNIRAVEAFQRIGFEIATEKADTDNPIYDIRWNGEMEPYRAFSKKYEDDPNPKEGFAAIMVCSQADEGCPFVFGSDFRLSLPYNDPKESDDTDSEGEVYDERVRQIGRELLFSLSQVKRG